MSPTHRGADLRRGVRALALGYLEDVSDTSNQPLHDEQDVAEALDEEVLSDVVDDPVGELVYPPDRFVGVNQYGTTPAEEQTGEPVEERALRDTPDPLDAIAEPNEEELRAIELDELERAEGEIGEEDGELAGVTDVGDETDADWNVGRLVEPGADDDGLDVEDIEAEAIATRADIDESDLSAEEAAVHLTRDPPLGRLGDGYLDD